MGETSYHGRVEASRREANLAGISKKERGIAKMKCRVWSDWRFPRPVAVPGEKLPTWR